MGGLAALSCQARSAEPTAAATDAMEELREFFDWADLDREEAEVFVEDRGLVEGVFCCDLDFVGVLVELCRLVSLDAAGVEILFKVPATAAFIRAVEVCAGLLMWARGGFDAGCSVIWLFKFAWAVMVSGVMALLVLCGKNC